MNSFGKYSLESFLIGATTLLTLSGFWNIYFGSESDANSYHHLHVATNLAWLSLLVCQLSLIGNGSYPMHRRVGLSVLGVAPLLVASATLLSVESARKGIASGRGDFMIVQNIMGTLELGLIIILAFALRRRRKLHASFLVSTALLFMGIALFFTLIGLVPGFKIDGPETFHHFGKALTTIQYTSLAVGLLFCLKSPSSGWPLLLVGSFFLLNELIRSLLAQRDLIQPLTEFVGSLNQPLAFVGSFLCVLLFLVATGTLKRSTKNAQQSVQPDRCEDAAPG